MCTHTYKKYVYFSKFDNSLSTYKSLCMRESKKFKIPDGHWKPGLMELLLWHLLRNFFLPGAEIDSPVKVWREKGCNSSSRLLEIFTFHDPLCHQIASDKVSINIFRWWSTHQISIVPEPHSISSKTPLGSGRSRGHPSVSSEFLLLSDIVY